MTKVDFVISNPSHHSAMMFPVIQTLLQQADTHCRILSLCEFRGFQSPALPFARERATLLKLLPFNLRPSFTRGTANPMQTTSSTRGGLRKLAWRFLLAPRVRLAFERPADVVVVPNDAAFPFNQICRLCRIKSVPFVLMQEGIRFAEFGDNHPDILNQGKEGAAAVAAWGESSARFFVSQGVAPERIFLTGNPRFEGIRPADWVERGQQTKNRYNLGERTLVFLSNPIESWGFCTCSEKMELVRQFILGIAPQFKNPQFRLVFKIHAKESSAAFQQVVDATPFAGQIVVLSDAPLYPLLAASQAAVIFATTAGLEALLFGLRLGVLEIPKLGFLHDFVSSGVAEGLVFDSTLNARVGGLFEHPTALEGLTATYLERELSTYDHSAERVEELIRFLAQKSIIKDALRPQAFAYGQSVAT